MGCWKWFDKFLMEAGIEVIEEHREEINEVIHRYIGEKASYGRCSTAWRKAREKIEANEQLKQNLAKELRLLFLNWIRYKKGAWEGY
jgi:hypothetical protein